MTEANLGEAPEAATLVDAGAHQQLFDDVFVSSKQIIHPKHTTCLG